MRQCRMHAHSRSLFSSFWFILKKFFFQIFVIFSRCWHQEAMDFRFEWNFHLSCLIVQYIDLHDMVHWLGYVFLSKLYFSLTIIYVIDDKKKCGSLQRLDAATILTHIQNYGTHHNISNRKHSRNMIRTANREREWESERKDVTRAQRGIEKYLAVIKSILR